MPVRSCKVKSTRNTEFSKKLSPGGDSKSPKNEPRPTRDFNIKAIESCRPFLSVEPIADSNARLASIFF